MILSEMEEIKSPLPARRIEALETEDREKINKILQPEKEVGTVVSEVKTEEKKGLPKILIGIIGGVALIVILMIVLIIIPKLKGKPAGDVTLNYWGLWEDSSVIGGVIADFEAKNPGIKINYKRNQKDDYRSRLKGRLNKETIEEVPDIFRIHSSWIPMFAENLAAVPSATVTTLKLESDFFDNYKSDLRDGNKYIGVPLMYDGLQLFYNKDLIEAARIELPKSWWDLETAANKLTVKDENGKIKIAGVAMGLTENVDQWSDIVGLMMKQNGVEPLTDDVAMNKKIQDVLTFYTMFKTKDGVWDDSLPSSTELFANGKLGFYFGQSWRMFNIEDLNPNLKYEVIGVPQLPTPEGGLTNINWSTFWMEGVSNKSKYQKEAWKFLEYLASAEGLEKMYAAASQTRSFGEIYPRKSLADKLSSNKKLVPWTQAANTAEGWYLASRTFDAGVNDEMSKYFKDAINAIVLQGATPEGVMPTLRSGINQIVQKYQLKR